MKRTPDIDAENAARQERLFHEQTENFARMVDEELGRLLTMGEQIPNLHDACLYSMGLDVEDRGIRGKRIRPALCLMTTEALGGVPRRALAFACCIEILHNFALVHDDIEDGDTMRRGRAATHVKYGLAHGINVGDYLLAKVFSILLREPHIPLAVREQLFDLLQQTLEHLFMGQSLDISARSKRVFTLSDYELIVVMKTGSYLAAPIIGGAMIAEGDEETIEALMRFGRSIGPLFQIRDDVIDLTIGKGRGEIGNDIREGKRSYLVAAAAEACGATERERLFDILDKPREATTEGDIRWCIDMFGQTGALRRAEEYCAELRRRGLAAIETVPVPLAQMLATALDVMVKRTV